MSNSPLYFSGTLWNRRGRTDLPILALHAGENDAVPWHSGQVNDALKFKDVFERIHEKAPLYIAVPQIFAMLFPVKAVEYDKFDISVHKDSMSNPNDISGIYAISIAYISMRNVSVHEKRILGSRYPSPPPKQSRYLDKTWGAHSMISTIEVGLTPAWDSVDVGIR